MKFFITVLGVYAYLVISLSFFYHESEAVPMQNCSMAGDQIGDTDNNTEYYICLPNGTDWTYLPQTCAAGGVFVPDPVSPGCVEQQVEITTTTELTVTTTEEDEQSSTTEKEQSTTEAEQQSTSTITESVSSTTEGISSVVTSTTESSSSEGTTEEETSSPAPEDSTTTESETTPQETTSQVTSTTEVPPTTEPPAVYQCPSEGRFPDPVDPCTKFYQCLQVGGVWYFYIYTCPAGTTYNSTLQVCTTGPCSAVPTTTTTAVTISTTTTTVAPPNMTTPSTDTCPSVGKFPVEGNCTSYYQCILVNSIWYKFTYNCPPSTHYDSTKTLCLAGACPATTTTPSTSTTSNATLAPGSTGTSETSTTTSPGYICDSEGKFQDPYNCAGYYQCILISGSWYTYKYTCPTGTIWNSSSQMCTQGTC